ncbi:MAG: hypothetical protein IJ667_13080 [Synergistaceae bacterium]|nr:hypothetical protein [Synergistaceae bacterium]
MRYAVCGMRYAVCGEHCAYSQVMLSRCTGSNWVKRNSVRLTSTSLNYSHSTLNNFYSCLAASLLKAAAGLISHANNFAAVVVRTGRVERQNNFCLPL